MLAIHSTGRFHNVDTMKDAVQQDRILCECGLKASVVPTTSRFEFDWRCRCGRRGVLSHAHHLPPPMFRRTRSVGQTQGELFATQQK